MKWTVQRYVLREVMQTWLAVTGVLVAILVSNQLSRVLGRAASDEYGRHVVFDLIALGALQAVAERGLEVPGHVSVTGFDAAGQGQTLTQGVPK